MDTVVIDREYGVRMARGLANLMNLPKVIDRTDEIRWRGGVALIRCCGPGVKSFGVTYQMVKRLDGLLAALVDEAGVVQVWELPPATFRDQAFDNDSRRAIGGKVKLIPRTLVESAGRLIASFPRAEVDRAAD